MASATILLVQNAQTQGNSTRRSLDRFGYDVIWAGSGLTALISAKNTAVDLILIDVALPDMEGLDLCRRFRKLDFSRAIPIMLLVGRGYVPESFGTAEERPDDYIEKPYTEIDLNARIASALRAKEARVSRPEPAPPVIETPERVPDQKPAAVPAPEPRPAQRPVLKLVPRSSVTVLPAAAPKEEMASGEVIDPATGLFSRQQFEAMLSKAFKQCVRFKQQMSCMLIDLDGAKMGRKADKELIKAVVALVQTTIREVDTAAWWSGESLIVLLPNTLRNDAVQAAARVLETVANHPFTWPDASQVTMSIGVAGLPDTNVDTEQKLIEAAALASRKALDMMVPVPKSLVELVRNREEQSKREGQTNTADEKNKQAGQS